MAVPRDVSVDEAVELVGQGALVLDVREQREWSFGRIDGAHHHPLNEVPDILATLTKDHLILCVCRSGSRSARAAAYLIENGFNAVNLQGGLQSWLMAGEPLVGDHDEPTII